MQRRRERTRAVILDIAEDKFATSCAAVRIDQLAEAADVSVGSIYQYFGSKDGLFLAVAERALDRVVERLEEAFEHDASPLAQMVSTGQVCLQMLLERPFLVRFMLDSAEIVDVEVLERIENRMDALYGAFATIIARAVDEGAVCEVDANLLARYLIGSWTGVLAMARSNPGNHPPVDDLVTGTIEQASRILLAGLTRPTEP